MWPHQPEKNHRGSLGLGGSVYEEAHPCFPYLVQPSFKSTDAGSIYHPLVHRIPFINHSVWKKNLQQSRVHRNLTSFLECPLIPLVLSARVKNSFNFNLDSLNKKLRYRRGTAQCVVSIEILPIATQQCRNYLYDKSWPNRWYEVGDLVGGNAW